MPRRLTRSAPLLDLHAVEILEAERGHLPDLVCLLGELFAMEHDFTPCSHHQLRGLSQLLEAREVGRVYVARYQNQIIGMASTLYTISTAVGGRVAMLEDVIVARPYRGLGVGSRLLKHVVDGLKRNGFLRVTLLTDRDNAGAMRFYERHGFTPSGMLPLRMSLYS